MFKKAEPKQAYLKIAFYGPQGSGKTASALLLAEGLAKATGKRVAYIDTEHGTDFYSKDVPQRAWHPKGFDFDAMYTRSLMDVVEAVKNLDLSKYGVLVIDSDSHIWEAAQAAYQGRMTKIGSIPVQAWNAIKKPYKEYRTAGMNMPIHFILCGRQTGEWDTNEESGQLEKVGVKMKSEAETPYEPHILVRMYQARSNGDGFERGQCVAYFEKDRTGLFTGKSIAEPSFETFRPILGLLGTEQAVMDTDTSEQDSTMIKDPAEAELEKMNLSIAIKDEFLTKIQEATSIAQLQTAWNELFAKDGARFRYKTKLLPEHLEFLTQMKDEKKRILTDKLV